MIKLLYGGRPANDALTYLDLIAGPLSPEPASALSPTAPRRVRLRATMPSYKPIDAAPDFDFYTAAEDVFDKLRDLVDVDDGPNNDAAALHVRAGALVARLKYLNRAANTAARIKKETTGDARTEMDQSSLGLQNLLYEKRHLEREIEKCRQFA